MQSLISILSRLRDEKLERFHTILKEYGTPGLYQGSDGAFMRIILTDPRVFYVIASLPVPEERQKIQDKLNAEGIEIDLSTATLVTEAVSQMQTSIAPAAQNPAPPPPAPMYAPPPAYAPPSIPTVPRVYTSRFSDRPTIDSAQPSSSSSSKPGTEALSSYYSCVKQYTTPPLSRFNRLLKNAVELQPFNELSFPVSGTIKVFKQKMPLGNFEFRHVRGPTVETFPSSMVLRSFVPYHVVLKAVSLYDCSIFLLTGADPAAKHRLSKLAHYFQDKNKAATDRQHMALIGPQNSSLLRKLLVPGEFNGIICVMTPIRQQEAFRT